MIEYSNVVFRKVSNHIHGHPLYGNSCDIIIHTKGIEINLPDVYEGTDFTSIDGSNLTLIPGLIELHSEANQPGREDRETLAETLGLAAMGGYTHLVTMPLSSPRADNRQVIEFQLKTVQNEIVQLLPSGTITKNGAGMELAEMYDMKQSGAVAFSDYKSRIKNSKLLLLAMQYARQLDIPLMISPGDVNLISFGMVHEGLNSTRLGLKAIPTIAESIGLKRDLDLVRYTGCRVHVQSISTLESIALIREAKDAGLPVTADVNMYHLLLTDDNLELFDSNYKTDPPLRDESVRQALIEAVKDGTIDAISADHQPRTYEEKVCEFDKAEYGLFTLPFVFGKLMESGIFSLNILLEKMYKNPAQILRLPQDRLDSYCMVDLKKKYTIKKDDLPEYKSLNSPFFGHNLLGKIEYIINKNKCQKISS